MVAVDYVSAIPRPGGSLVKENSLYSYSDRLTYRDEIRPAGAFFDPSWIDETRTVLFSGSGVWTDPVGPAEPTEWFNDGDYAGDGELPQDIADGDVAGDKVAVVWGNDHEVLGIYRRADSSYSTDPVRACAFSEPTGGEFSEPTLAPDASAVAWQEGDGVWAYPCPLAGARTKAGSGSSSPGRRSRTSAPPTSTRGRAHRTRNRLRAACRRPTRRRPRSTCSSRAAFGCPRSCVDCASRSAARSRASQARG